MELQSLSPGFVIPHLADTQDGSWGLSGAGRIPLKPAEAQGQNQASSGRGGELSQRSAGQLQSTAPCPAPALPREGDTEPRGAPGTEQRPGGAQEGQAGPNLPRAREGQGDEEMPLSRHGEGSRHPRRGGCCAGEGDAWLVPSRARRRLKVPSARPRSPAPRDAGCGRTPRVPPHLKSL